jgi:hypothetical protein
VFVADEFFVCAAQRQRVAQLSIDVAFGLAGLVACCSFAVTLSRITITNGNLFNTLRGSAALWLVVTTTLILVAGGCGGSDRPPLGRCSGTVTIDGAPLSGVIVIFQPEEGRAAVATTDSEGRYEVMYVGGVKGSKVGPTNVMFAAPTGGSPSHPIPPKYQGKTDLNIEVMDGSNVFDFDLKSEGAAPKRAGAKPAVID